MKEKSTTEAPTYRNYVDQCLHYLDRAHEGLPDGPVKIPAAWYGDEVGSSDQWCFLLDEDDVSELDRAL